MKFKQLIVGFSCVGAASVVAAQDLTATRLNVFGRQGVIETPSAEVAPDGQLALSYAQFSGVSQTTLTFQVAPRLSASFRYSSIDDLLEGGDTYRDHAFDFSYLLLNEGRLRPAVSFGINDFIGTGLRSSEYVVATKSIGERLRVSGGLGWGRLASDNALDVFSGSRDTSFDEDDVGLTNDRWFSGPAAVFGGLTYELTDKITLLAEYSSDGYDAEVDAGIFDNSTPFNFGVDYKLGRATTLSAFYLHGNEIGLSFSASLNPKAQGFTSGNEIAPLPILTRPTRAADPEGWSREWISQVGDGALIQKALVKAMASEGLELEAMSLEFSRVEIRFRNTRYGSRAQALGRLSRILTRAVPPSVETFVLTETLDGVPAHSTVVSRSALEAKEFDPARELLETTQFVDPRAIDSGTFTKPNATYPRKLWSISPYIGNSDLDLERAVNFEYGLRGDFNYEFAPGISLDAAATARIVGTTSDASSVSEDSTLFPVRTSSILYDDAIQLEKLTANIYSHPGKNVFGRVSTGYFETQYGGVSGELLWKKPTSRIALGVEANYAVLRDPDDAFGFEDYDVFTGHVSAYYGFDNGYHGQVDVGRFLAGDWGATVSVDREFNNGWRVGAYATVTDAPSESFGDGSFDRGIRVSVPTAWFSQTPSLKRNEFSFQPSIGDAGARLKVDGRLYERVRPLQGTDIEDRWGRFWR